jgi:hypothetical protein
MTKIGYHIHVLVSCYQLLRCQILLQLGATSRGGSTNNLNINAARNSQMETGPTPLNAES